MKNLDLFTFGVEEINEVQMQEVDGGILALIVSGFIGYIVWDCCMNPSDAWAQLEAGYNSK